MMEFLGFKHVTGSKERYLLGQDKTSKFSGDTLCRPTKRHLSNSKKVKKKKMKNEMES